MLLCSACRHQARLLARRPVPSASAVAVAAAVTPASAPARRFFSQQQHQQQKQQQQQKLSLAHPTRRPTTAAAARLFSTSSSLRGSAAAAAPTATPLAKPDFLNDAESHIWDLLVAAFDPAELSVQDISGGCGSMYGIDISSDKFRGANMLKQQRMVNAALGDLVKSWHGVQLKTRTP